MKSNKSAWYNLKKKEAKARLVAIVIIVAFCLACEWGLI